MNLLISKIWLLILLGLSINLIHAQSDVHIGHIGSEDGLNSELIQHIVEDDFGNLWISSFETLQKYNGYSFSNINVDKEQGFESNFIVKLWKDGLGNIWTFQGELTTQENTKFWNLYCLDTKIKIVNTLTDEVVEFQDYIGSDQIKSEDVVKIIYQNDRLFLCTKDNLIYSFTDKLEYFTKVEDLQNVITINAKSEIIFLENDILITKNSDGKIIHQTDSQILLDYEFLVSSSSGKIFLIDVIDNNVIIKEFNQKQIDHLATLDKNDIKYRSDIYYKLEKFNEGQLLINGELFIKSGKNDYKKVNPVKAKLINEYFLSKTGLGYAATNVGIYIFNNYKQIFQKLAFDEIQKNSVRGIFVNKNFSFHKVYNHEIIIDKSGENELEFLKNLDLGYMAYGHYQDPINENHLWSFGLIPNRIRKIDFENKKVDYFSLESPDMVNSFLRSSSTSKMYASSSIGPIVLDEEQRKIQKLRVDTLLGESISSNHIIEKNGELWFAMTQGVLRYNEANSEFRLHNIFKGKNSFAIQFMHEDKIDPEVLWLGTKKGGMVKWETSTDSIQLFNTSNGLSNNDVHAIIEDNSNRLWVSTNRYLNCFDKNTNRISVFTENDGLSDPEFNKYSFFFDTEKNEIYFGGLNGYNFFNADSISTTSNERTINVRIIDALKTKNDGKNESIYFDLIKSKSIDFLQEDLSLELELTTNYLSASEARQFSYRIPKLNQNWRTQNSNILKLNRLPYGKFEIEIISDLYKPSFTSNILTLQLNVVKPFSKTWLFYLLIIVGLILITWWSIKKYFKILSDRNMILEQEVKARTRELTESNNTKNMLFAILAHDLRNPISSLTNLSAKVKFLTRNDRLDELDALAQKTDVKLGALNDNLNNLLLWATKESKLSENKIEKVSPHYEVNKITELYEDSINQKKLIINNNIPEISIVYADVTIVQTIIRNLISNAIKFSYDGGLIEYTLENKKGSKELKVTDQGIGLKKKDVVESEKVISIRKNVEGTGIGLKLCKELTAKTNLKLSVIPNPKGGTIGLLQFSEQHNQAEVLNQ